MILLLLYALTLVAAVLISERAERTVMSLAVLFLLVGSLAAERTLGLVTIDPSAPFVSNLVTAALVAILFSDGARLSLDELRDSVQLPGRALLLGLPLTLVGTAVLAHYLTDLPWIPALLLGAILSPTDPVLASAIIGREGIPLRLRRLLNIESGFNDGLALPFVIVLLRVLVGEHAGAGSLLLEVAVGALVGVVIPWTILRIEGSRFFAVSPGFRPLLPISIALLTFAVSSLLHANEFVAAFTAGIAVATFRGDVVREFHAVGEPVTELLKLGALLLLGGLISLPFLKEIPPLGYVFAALALLMVRPIALWLALPGKLPKEEFLTAAWFGPKGFASVAYALLVFRTGAPHADLIFHLAALVTAASIVLHSSTDIPIAQWFERRSTEDYA